MKKRSSNQIKGMIICLAILVLVVLIVMIIFLSQVKKENIQGIQINENTQSTENAVIEKPYYEVNTDNLDTKLENINTRYNIVKSDENGIFKVVLNGKKLYFTINDKEKFNKAYENVKFNIDEEIEIAIHDYKIVDFEIGKIKNDLYLIVVTDSGKIGVMNMDVAINKNVFRIKNELIGFDSSVMQIQNVIKVSDSNEENTIVVITADQKNYDLESFVE